MHLNRSGISSGDTPPTKTAFGLMTSESRSPNTHKIVSNRHLEFQLAVNRFIRALADDIFEIGQQLTETPTVYRVDPGVGEIRDKIVLRLRGSCVKVPRVRLNLPHVEGRTTPHRGLSQAPGCGVVTLRYLEGSSVPTVIFTCRCKRRPRYGIPTF